MESQEIYTSEEPPPYEVRLLALRRRVSEAASSLTEQGIRPTVTRVRAALGGGSPNDLAPALKAWRESPTAGPAQSERPGLPIQIADLCVELWQRASVAARVEMKGGLAARSAAVREADAESLHSQVRELRDQLQREFVKYGELRGQAARHEAVARDALTRLDESEARARRQLRDLGETRERVVELEATTAQLRTSLAGTTRTSHRASTNRSRRKGSPAVRSRRPKKKGGLKQADRTAGRKERVKPTRKLPKAGDRRRPKRRGK